MKKLEEILLVLNREKNWPIKQAQDGHWEITVPCMDGRQQIVHATPRLDREQDAVVSLWSIIGKRDKVKDPLSLLELNAKLSYSACAFDGENVILRHSHLVKDADVTEMAKTINYIGNKAPSLYKEFFNE